MKVIVELDVFSGRPNPAWQLGSDLAQKVRGLLQTDVGEKVGVPNYQKLGYRGFILHIDADDPLSVDDHLRVFSGLAFSETGQPRQAFVVPHLEELLIEEAKKQGHGAILEAFQA